MARRHLFFIAIFLLHFTLVVLGAFQLRPKFPELFGTLITLYADLSGASSAYGFFAPEVPSSPRAVFEVTNQDGESLEVSLQTGHSREGDLRIGNMIGLFWDKIPDETLRRSFTASWAAKIFSRYPKAQEVTVKLELYRLPPSYQYVEGARGTWSTFYKATHHKRAQ